MNPRTTLTMANGRGIDLLNPRAEDIDFAVIAEHLSKANRYCGATPDVSYSVAEHSVRCADAAFAYGCDPEDVAYCLCHDMHEAFLGDDTTPKKKALESIARSFGVLAGTIEEAFGQLTDNLDAAIHEAAGLAWPPPARAQGIVKMVDRWLLATEWRDLMKCEAPYDFETRPLPDRIVPRGSYGARIDFLMQCYRLLPGYADTARKSKGRG